ncbi:NPL4-like protein 2 [Seminavis robusta]|uniref:NPL4-like protein 2 n=1 Tax=Seminavis robusta TaxID=568900 RepID=A0A9N8DUQ2_9STRA|nr:NPL4-like protein 2 [Seminavis robusta]|eukprot:Sro295_g110450.1 NPL4-like protein 2 (482) ;mRNA; f:37716-39161
MLLRVRSNVGVWRVENLDEATATVSDVLEGIAKTRPHVTYEKPLSFDPGCLQPLNTTQTLAEQKLRHGSMVHCRVDAGSCAEVKVMLDANEANEAPSGSGGHMKRVIDKDGAIKLVPATEAAGGDKGFRKGMLPLRDMKMAWRLDEFIAMDSQYEFKIQRQPEAICKQVSLDSPSIGDFQAYCAQFAFQRKRMAFLYGKFVPVDAVEEGKENDKMDVDEDDKKKPVPMKAVVEAIYEPPQEVDNEAAEGLVQLEDPNEDKVEQLSQMLGLRKVGWIFGHAPREDGFVMNGAEVIMAAEFQLEAAEGVEETPFVTVKVTTGKDGNVSVEAFQVSQQCMAMVAEEALEIDSNPGFCKVNDTFTAIMEGKASKNVENNFFLTVVPIVSHTSKIFVSQFPKFNRDAFSAADRTPSKAELKKQLGKAGTAGWTMVDLLSDFQLLLYLGENLDMNADMPKICESVVDRSVPLDDGYAILIKGIAGLL